EKGRRIRELTSFVHKRFEFCKNNVGLYAKRVTDIVEAAVDKKS
ncbi:40S ribosomal protein S3-1-like protein, partial [Tanacetum coccineum]